MRLRNDKLQELIAEQAAEWYVAHRDGNLGDEQARAFMRWLRASPAHVAEYLSIAGLAQDLAGAAAKSTLTREQLLADAEAASTVSRLPRHQAGDATAATPPAQTAGTLKGRIGLFSPWTSAFAAMLVIVVATAFWFSPQRGQQHYSTHHGEQRTLQLPDNSVVRLNSDSAIAVRFSDTRRDVDVLRGQVYFEIGEDAARPFNVRAGSYLIEDIGTTFDVYRKSSETTVTVVEGRVRVWEKEIPTAVSQQATGADPDAKAPAPLADLGAGAQVQIASSGKIQVQRPNVQVATAWVQEKIVFESDAIATVAAEFNRYNRQQIIISDPRVGTIPISGVFRSYDVQSFVDFLNGLPGVSAEMIEGRILVKDGRSKAG
jgi:transmembrane sensor